MPKASYATVIRAPLPTVWKAIRPFDCLQDWHPGVAKVVIRDGESHDRVGCVRDIHLSDEAGSVVTERLVALSDLDASLAYSMFEPNIFAVTDYVAVMKLIAVSDDDSCFLSWSAHFGCDPAKEADLIHTFAEGIYRGGIENLKTKL